VILRPRSDDVNWHAGVRPRLTLQTGAVIVLVMIAMPDRREMRESHTKAC